MKMIQPIASTATTHLYKVTAFPVPVARLPHPLDNVCPPAVAPPCAVCTLPHKNCSTCRVNRMSCCCVMMTLGRITHTHTYIYTIQLYTHICATKARQLADTKVYMKIDGGCANAYTHANILFYIIKQIVSIIVYVLYVCIYV